VPAKFHDLVPHQVGSEEKGFAWLVNGDEVLSARAGAGSVINKDGTKTGAVGLGHLGRASGG
jgi:hypothetical protein